ncbi:MAG: hypothetical protein HY611_06865, partial [Elusimicrobia bacterium]|nr:hypothetical protein [Elusimicrobiota bacterium]
VQAQSFLSAGLPQDKKSGRHQEPDYEFSWEIEYLESRGHTVVGAAGIDYYHDWLSATYNWVPVMMTHEDIFLPSRYFGVYPLYYGCETMNYRIRITNEGHRLKRLKIEAIQEYLNAEGGIGVRMGADAHREWFVEDLKRGETATFEGSIALPCEVLYSGLDQTHLKIWRVKQEDRRDSGDGLKLGQDQQSHEKLLEEAAQAAIFCPPGKKPKAP